MATSLWTIYYYIDYNNITKQLAVAPTVLIAVRINVYADTKPHRYSF